MPSKLPADLVPDVDDALTLAAAVAEREERLRAALYASRTGTFRWDIRTNALDWDENLDRLFGLVPGQTVRSLDGFLACVHEDDRARVVAACERCAALGADFDEEFRVVWPDGSLHWLDDKGRTFHDASGAPAYMTGACVEITERKRDAAALRESEARLRRILESGVAGAFVWHIDGAVTETNDAFLALLGYTDDDVREGRVDWRTLTPSRWEEADSLRVAELNATGRHGPYEKEYLAKDGTPVPVLIASAFFEGSRTQGVALCIDRRPQQRAETALSNQHALAVALAAAASEEDIGAVLLDHAMRTLSADAGMVLRFDGAELWRVAAKGYDARTAARWTRYAPDPGTPSGVVSHTGEPIYLATYDDWRAAFPNWLEWVENNGVEGYAAVPIRLGDRVLGVLALTFNAARVLSDDDRDALAGSVAQAGQAFDRARLYREAIEARREAERARSEAELANHAKSAFLATMSHELRTPLNAIGGYVDLLEMGIRGPVTDAQLDDLSRIRRSQKHLLGLINDVLNFAKLGAGTIRYELQNVQVAHALAMAEIMVAPQISSKGLRFAVAPGPMGTMVRADPEKLQQVLLNLLSNAVKFTDRGGELTVACEVRADVVALDVRDTGIGIPADKLAQIFEPFVQIDRHFSRPSEGAGLGLAISRELARGMGGDLSVTSALDTGSTFTITLPLAT